MHTVSGQWAMKAVQNTFLEKNYMDEKKEEILHLYFVCI